MLYHTILCYIIFYVLYYIICIMLRCYTVLFHNVLHHMSALIQKNTKYNYLTILYSLLLYAVIVDGIVLL